MYLLYGALRVNHANNLCCKHGNKNVFGQECDLENPYQPVVFIYLFYSMCFVCVQCRSTVWAD